MGVIEERAWWDHLSDDQRRIDAWGDPPYSAAAAARVVSDKLGLLPGNKVLDLGCGPCRTAAQVANLSAAEVLAVDISHAMLEDSVEIRQGLVSRHLGDGRTIPTGLSFDHAYSITMFEHIPHEATQSYIQQIYDRLPAGGGFVFTHAPGWDRQLFLHHQCGSEYAPLNWLLDAGFEEVGFIVDLPPVLKEVGGWAWYEARKS